MTYLQRTGLVALVVLGVLGSLNALVDPFGMFGAPVLRGFNANKAAVSKYIRFSKPLSVISQRPEILLLGTSRLQYGIDPDILSGAHQRAYNFGIPAMTMHEAEAFGLHAIRTAPLREMVIGLDMFSFGSHVEQQDGFDENLLRGFITPYAFFQGALSYTALQASATTIQVNRADPDTIEYRLNGFRQPWDRSHEDVIEGIRESVVEYATDPALYRDFTLDSDALAGLERLIEAAQADGVLVRMFISPIHASLTETVHALGLWPQLEAWKAALAEIGERHDVELYDFSGYNEVTTVPVDRAVEYYFDASHYWPRVGERIMRRTRGLDTADVSPGGFGFRVTVADLPAHLAAIRSQREAYVRNRASDVRRVRSILAALDHPEDPAQSVSARLP